MSGNGVEFSCPNCGVHIAAYPTIAVLRMDEGHISVTFNDSEFEHECRRQG